jgi:hypothetical protein
MCVRMLQLQDLEGKQWTAGQEILEFHPFEADESQMLKHPLARCASGHN